jgi:hypothetical protein
MSHIKHPSSAPPGLEADDDDAPRSTVQLKTKPWLDRKLEQLAQDCADGLITPEAMTLQLLDACEKWAEPYLTPDKRAQVRAWVQDMALADAAMRSEWEHKK